MTQLDLVCFNSFSFVYVSLFGVWITLVYVSMIGGGITLVCVCVSMILGFKSLVVFLYICFGV